MKQPQPHFNTGRVRRARGPRHLSVAELAEAKAAYRAAPRGSKMATIHAYAERYNVSPSALASWATQHRWMNG